MQILKIKRKKSKGIVNDNIPMRLYFDEMARVIAHNITYLITNLISQVPTIHYTEKCKIAGKDTAGT